MIHPTIDSYQKKDDIIKDQYLYFVLCYSLAVVNIYFVSSQVLCWCLVKLQLQVMAGSLQLSDERV